MPRARSSTQVSLTPVVHLQGDAVVLRREAGILHICHAFGNHGLLLAGAIHPQELRGARPPVP